MSLARELGRGKFLIILSKKMGQRKEHIASLSWKYKKMYPKAPFKTIHVFETVPNNLMEVVRIIELKGRKYDGSISGEYALTVRPRGKGSGRMLGGCDIHYNRFKIEISTKHRESKDYCTDPAFMRLLATKKICNTWLKDRLKGKMG